LRALRGAHVGELTVLEVSQGEASRAGDDEVEDRPAKD